MNTKIPVSTSFGISPTRLFFASTVAILALTCANQAPAQVVVDSSGPLSRVGWSSPAYLCTLLPGSAASTINYATGAVSFATNSYGTIGLVCNVQTIGNDVYPGDINRVALTFSDPNAYAGCNASVYFVDRTTGLSDGYVEGTPYTGRWTVNVNLTSKTVPLTNHTYDVDVYLLRLQSAGNSCNPVAYGLFLE